MKIKELTQCSAILPAMALPGRKWFMLGFLLLAAFIACLPPAQAQNKGKAFVPVLVGKTAHGGAIGSNIIVQQDPGKKVTQERIRQTMGAVLAGKIAPNNIIPLGLEGTSTWLAFKLLNKDAGEDWVLDLGRVMDGRSGHLEAVRVYEMPLAYPGAIEKPQFYLNDITTDTDDGYYKIRVAPQTQKLIILNIIPGSGLPVTIAPMLHEDKAMTDVVYGNAFTDVFYTLFLMGFATLALAVGLYHRKASTIVFSAYFFLLALTYTLFENYGADTSFSSFKSMAVSLGLGHALLALISTKIFCNINQSRVTERYILYGLMGLSALASGVTLIFPLSDGVLQSSITQGIPFAVYLVVTLMSYAQMMSKNIRGYSYFLSWLFPLAGFIITALATEGILPMSAITLNALWISYLPQGLLLSIALMRHLRLADREEGSAVDAVPSEVLNLKKLKQTRDDGDHSRLLRVIEKERDLLADLKQREATRLEEMRRAKEEADEANRAKSAFLAVVSHEIRTPMTGIMGMVRLLLDSNVSRQQKDYVLTIQESGDAMLGLLNDILDFEKIQRGKMELENISFDLHRLIQGVVALMSGHAAQKQVTLSARVDDDLPRFVKGDPTRLRQVLLNLMGNALKFTEKGSVTLLIKNLQNSDGESSNNNQFMIYFAVTDTGIGISETAQKNLFSPFAQADSTIARKFGGSGLGLAISKGLVEAMGSTVNINSQPGEGSTFFFTLKMERGISSLQDSAKKAPERLVDIPKIDPLRILVVDDNTINRKVIGSFLAQDNHILTSSTTAEDALEKIEAQDFDLVLMDIELPGISGNEATKTLRGHSNPMKAHLPVIALTGNIGKDDMGRYLADGMNDMIPKPIDPDQLRSKIVEVMTRSNEREIRSPVITTVQEAAPIATPVPVEPIALTEQPPTIPVDVDATVFNPQMLQSLKDAIGGDQLQKLLDELIEKTDDILSGMDLASRAGNMELLSVRAHELKGMAGNFGLVEISEIAGTTEQKAKTNEQDGITDLVKSLPAARERAQQALKTWVGGSAN